MENENLTKLTKGFVQIHACLPVPIKEWCLCDDTTFSLSYQFKICRYVGSSCRVIGSYSDYDEAVEKLNYWRDWYKTNDIFLVKVCLEVHKESI